MRVFGSEFPTPIFRGFSFLSQKVQDAEISEDYSGLGYKTFWQKSNVISNSRDCDFFVVWDFPTENPPLIFNDFLYQKIKAVRNFDYIQLSQIE